MSASRALPKMITALAAHPSPVLLDLGPVVGANVEFLGGRLSCKMLIEDLRRDVDAAIGGDEGESLGDVLVARVKAAAVEPVHGVLCWDIFDFLDRPTGRALAACIREVVRPKGVVHGLFGTTSIDLDYRSKFILQSEVSMKWRREPAAPVRRQALQPVEVTRLFEGLSTMESVLLQNRTREVLFRKP